MVGANPIILNILFQCTVHNGPFEITNDNIFNRALKIYSLDYIPECGQQ